MSIQFVGSSVGANNSSSASSTSVNYTSSAGNVLVLGVVTNTSGVSVQSITDSAGNTTWVRSQTFTPGGGSRTIEVWLLNNQLPITSVTITMTGNGAFAAVVSEYSGSYGGWIHNASAVGTNNVPGVSFNKVGKEDWLVMIAGQLGTNTYSGPHTSNQGNIRNQVFSSSGTSDVSIVLADGNYGALGTPTIALLSSGSTAWTATLTDLGAAILANQPITADYQWIGGEEW